MNAPSKRASAVIFSLAAAFSTVSGEAGTVTNLTSGGVTQSTASFIDLSAAGQTNWSAWFTTSTTTVASRSAYSTKVGGIGTIGDILPAGSSSNVRGTSAGTSYVNGFTWTGGTAAPTTGDSNRLTGIFGGNPDTDGNGVHLAITNLAPLTAGQSYQISVYGAVFNGQGTMTASVGSSSVSQLSVDTDANERRTDLFQFNYTPDNISDSLDLQFLLTRNGTGGSSHVTLQAVAISIIPEPSAALLALGSCLAPLFRRRRA